MEACLPNSAGDLDDVRALVSIRAADEHEVTGRDAVEIGLIGMHLVREIERVRGIASSDHLPEFDWVVGRILSRHRSDALQGRFVVLVDRDERCSRWCLRHARRIEPCIFHERADEPAAGCLVAAARLRDGDVEERLPLVQRATNARLRRPDQVELLDGDRLGSVGIPIEQGRAFVPETLEVAHKVARIVEPIGRAGHERMLRRRRPSSVILARSSRQRGPRHAPRRAVDVPPTPRSPPASRR